MPLHSTPIPSIKIEDNFKQAMYRRDDAPVWAYHSFNKRYQTLLQSMYAFSVCFP